MPGPFTLGTLALLTAALEAGGAAAARLPAGCKPPAEGQREAEVRTLLGAPHLERRGMNGAGVLLVVIDTPVNVAHVQASHPDVRFRPDLGVTASGTLPSGAGDRAGHGTMVAHLATVMAPHAAITEISSFDSPDERLKTTLLGYRKLARLIARERLFDLFRGIVVIQSWGTNADEEDKVTPLRRAIGELAEAGVDFVFAAGNSGACESAIRKTTSGGGSGDESGSITDLSSHPDVLTVAAVDVQRRRLPDSSQGPGSWTRRKPDISGYSNVQVSFTMRDRHGVHLDRQTSAAAALVAGVVAAVRSCVGRSLTPAQLFARIREYANPRVTRADGTAPITLEGHDPDFGTGVVDPERIADSIAGCAKPKA